MTEIITCGRCGVAIPCNCRECGRCGAYNLAPERRRFGSLRDSDVQAFCADCADQATRNGAWQSVSPGA